MIIIFDDIVYSLQKAGGISELFSQISNYISGDICHLFYDNANHNLAFHKISGQQYQERSSFLLQIKRYINPNIKCNEPYIFHSTYYRTSRAREAINITTVHDFMYEIYNHKISSLFHKIQKRNAVFKSDGVICISENTKKDLQKYYPSFDKPIAVIPNGYDNSNYYFMNSPRKKQLVYTGARKGYKSFFLAVEIAKALKDYHLLIIGGGDLTSEEKVLLSGVNYTKYGFLPSSELCKIYNTSFLLLYTSAYEGFGITPIEAQACGCLVACQMTSSIPEVVQDTAITIHPADIKKTVTTIKSYEEEAKYNELQEAGLKNTNRFSWEKTAKEYLLFYKYIESLHND